MHSIAKCPICHGQKFVDKATGRPKMKQAKYNDVRKLMMPGDVIAFGGRGFISEIIKMKTDSHVSHVGIIFQANVTVTGRMVNQIIESTSLGDGFAGVQINRMSTRIEQYEGEVWWLPLSTEARSRMDEPKFFNFLLDQKGKHYDAPQAIGSAIDFIPDNKEDFSKLFCSELASAALEISGVIPPINASEETPIDVCLYDIYGEVVQIKGEPLNLF
jgi:hypothetical protein